MIQIFHLSKGVYNAVVKTLVRELSNMIQFLVAALGCLHLGVGERKILPLNFIKQKIFHLNFSIKKSSKEVDGQPTTLA
jgi:hypothetical protein